MNRGVRQEVLNVLLAQLLSSRGMVSAPENLLRLEGRRHMPDVLVNFRGLRIAIEGEVGDHFDAQNQAVHSASERVKKGIAHIGIAVVYPPELRFVRDIAHPEEELGRSVLQIAIVTELGATQFVQADVNQLEATLRVAYDQLIREDVVTEAVETLDATIDHFALAMQAMPGAVQRMAEVLSIAGDTPEEHHAASRVAGLVLVNALIFEEILAEVDHRVQPVGRVLATPNPMAALAAMWTLILDQIDYVPIFLLARDLLNELPANPDALAQLRALTDTAQQIVLRRAALRHDLMGRIFHRLLTTRKYLATYYTRIPAAALLLHLALRPDGYPGVHWENLGRGQDFKVADLACGTGTLLMAAADVLTNNYIEASIDNNQPIEIAELQKAVAESVIHGYDVLPSAIHLTASTLATRAPEIAFESMNMWSLPLGGPQHRLGSIEFLETEYVPVADMFGARPMIQAVGGRAVEEVQGAPLPRLDLCVMNPPFTRSVGNNLLFGGIPEEERGQMQARLRRMLAQPTVLANATAGLGAVFVAIANRYIKEGGRIALILPKALLSGVAWAETRQLLARNFQLEYLVTSQDPIAWNFSESTSMSEVLLVARRTENDLPQAQSTGTLVAVNLWRNMTTAFEAQAIVHHLLREGLEPPDVLSGRPAMPVRLGDEKVGEAFSYSWPIIRRWPMWILPCAFAQGDLIRVALALAEGNIWLPQRGHVGQVPMCSLEQLGSLGFDRRDIWDAFEESRARTLYPALWGHDTESVQALTVEPNRFLSPLAAHRPGRPFRDADHLWGRAGRILLAERIRLTTVRAVAVRTPEKVLSNTWWTFAPRDDAFTEAHEKALMLWLNSTLGLIQLLANREETEGAWIDYKKPVLAALPVLDVRLLGEHQLQQLAATYDTLAGRMLQRMPQFATDPVRADIDTALTDALGLPNLGPLRMLLAQEPIISSQQL